MSRPESRPPRRKRGREDAPPHTPRGGRSAEKPAKPASESAASRATAPGTVRIIGGHHRGRVLRYSGDPRTRPMKDRVREAVFNLIGPAVKEKHVLDLFAGTGALGFEALSRGAARATFFERHFPTASILGENAKTLGLTERCQILPANTLIQFRKPDPFAGVEPSRAWLVFCSPPYSLYLSQPDALLDMLGRILAQAPSESLFVVESDDRFDPGVLPRSTETEPDDAWDVRDYPPARIALYRKP